MRAVWLLVFGLAAGCSNTNQVVCYLDEFAQADIAGRGNIMQCSAALDNVDGGASGNPWAAAQKCVLDAIAAKQGFILLYDVPDPSGARSLRAGFTGYSVGSDKVIVHAYAFSAKQPNDTDPTVSQRTCNQTPALLDTNANPMTPCTPGPGNPCLTCNSSIGGTLLCGFQP